MKTAFLVVLILFCSLFILNNLYGQDQIIKEGRTYTYQSHSFKYEELKDILQNSEPAYKHYQRYLSSSKKAKIFGYTSLGLMAAGIYYGVIKEEKNCSSGGVCENTVTGILLGLSSIIPGTLAIIYVIRASDQKTKSIKTFNNESVKEEVSLGLGATKNGIGIIINF